MALIDDLKSICDRLSPLGWGELLRSITNPQLDILQPSKQKLITALTTPLAAIDRTKSGFEDFHPLGQQGITPGKTVSHPWREAVLPGCDCASAVPAIRDLPVPISRGDFARHRRGRVISLWVTRRRFWIRPLRTESCADS